MHIHIQENLPSYWVEDKNSEALKNSTYLYFTITNPDSALILGLKTKLSHIRKKMRWTTNIHIHSLGLKNISSDQRNFNGDTNNLQWAKEYIKRSILFE